MEPTGNSWGYIFLKHVFCARHSVGTNAASKRVKKSLRTEPLVGLGRARVRSRTEVQSMSFRDAGRVERFRESRNPARGGPSSLSSHCPSAPRSDIPSRQERVSGPDSPSPVFCLVGWFSQVTFLSQIPQIRCGGNGAEHLCPNRHDTHLTRVLS